MPKVIFPLLALLTGCAPLLGDLQSLNANLSSINSSLRGSGGSTAGGQVINATAGNICNRAAYEDGFKRQYNRGWNDVIPIKRTFFLAAINQNPNDTAAQHNYALYRGRKVDAPKMGTSRYDTGDDPCARQSYSQGQQDGGQAADRDIGALESQEI